MSQNHTDNTLPNMQENNMHSTYFCSECGNLYDITNVPPDASDTVATKSSPTGIYFVCTTCGNTEAMKPLTLVVSRKSQNISKEYFGNEIDPKNLADVHTFPHTRNYICPNKKCLTHPEPKTRDAVMFRIGNSLRMMYMCTVCNTMWKTV